MLKEIVITEEPVCACVPKDFPLTLRCRAQGASSLHYQWFQPWESTYREIPGANQPDLHIVAKQTQLYICRVNNQHRGIVFSQWVKVRVIKDVPRGLVPDDWEGEPIIVAQPVPTQVMPQHPVLFSCCTLGIPAPQYQWYHNGNSLPNNSRQFLIEAVKPGNCGSYLCCVSNARGERWSEPADLTIVEQDVILQEPRQPVRTEGKRPANTYYAAGKVALLIGNNGYLNHPNLLAPMVDVYELSVLLRKIGFSVESLVDLNREDMHTAVDQFLDRLDQGVYGLFYYAGHGYERSGRNYMVPTDAPQPYRPENCISVQKILQEMQGRKTALNVVLLDTCRKWYNSDCAMSKVLPLKPLGNSVYGYATSENAEAYEVQDGDFSSGIFMTYLKKHIMKEKKVTHMLEDVLEEIGDDPLVKGKQVMEIKHTLKESRSLTDKIRPLRNTCVRRTQLEQHRRLPRQMIKFSCGVEVELRFRSVFSNLIHAFARLTFAPPHMTDIRIILYNPDTTKHSLSNHVGHDHLNSLLAIGSDGEEADSMLRLHGLQKVKNDIVIKIDLHYTILSTETRAQDSLEHRIPKAWVAKSGSRNGTSLTNGDPESGATLCTSVPASHAQPNAMFTDYMAGAHSLGKESGMPISAQSKSNSEPEENDESEHIPMT